MAPTPAVSRSAAAFAAAAAANAAWSQPGTFWIWASRQRQPTPPGVHFLPAPPGPFARRGGTGACCTLTLLDREIGAAVQADTAFAPPAPTGGARGTTCRRIASAGAPSRSIRRPAATRNWRRRSGRRWRSCRPPRRRPWRSSAAPWPAAPTSPAACAWRDRRRDAGPRPRPVPRQNVRFWCREIVAEPTESLAPLGHARSGGRARQHHVVLVGAGGHRDPSSNESQAIPADLAREAGWLCARAHRVGLTARSRCCCPPFPRPTVPRSPPHDHRTHRHRPLRRARRRHDRRPGPGVEVLHGTNETGKTSLLEFVRGVFFGFGGLFRRGVLDPEPALRRPARRRMPASTHDGSRSNGGTRGRTSTGSPRAYADDVVGLGGDSAGRQHDGARCRRHALGSPALPAGLLGGDRRDDVHRGDGVRPRRTARTATRSSRRLRQPALRTRQRPRPLEGGAVLANSAVGRRAARLERIPTVSPLEALRRGRRRACSRGWQR